MCIGDLLWFRRAISSFTLTLRYLFSPKPLQTMTDCAGAWRLDAWSFHNGTIPVHTLGNFLWRSITAFT